MGHGRRAGAARRRAQGGDGARQRDRRVRAARRPVDARDHAPRLRRWRRDRDRARARRAGLDCARPRTSRKASSPTPRGVPATGRAGRWLALARRQRAPSSPVAPRASARPARETLAREGASVLITDIDDLRGKEVVARIAKAGGKAHYLRHDVRDEAAWPGVIAEAEKRFGRLDIMVANAGIGIMAPIAEMTLGRLAAPAGDQPRRRVPVDQARDPGAEEAGRRLDRADVVDRGPARRAGARGLFGDQGRRAACWPSRWRSSMRPTTSAATRCIPASSPRRSGRRSRPAPRATAAMRRSIRASAPPASCR